MQKTLEVSPRFSPEVEERMEDFSHRVLDRGKEKALKILGELGQDLLKHLDDEQAFWYYASQAYVKSYRYQAESISALSNSEVALHYAAIQQSLTQYYLQDKAEEDALTFMLDSRHMWKLLEAEIEAVAQRLSFKLIFELVQGGYKGWKRKHEKFSRTPLWSEHPMQDAQLQSLFVGLKNLGYIHKQTKEGYFKMLFTASHPGYKIVWSQKGLGSLVYLIESLLREGYLQAPEEVLAATMKKEPLQHEAVVMPWIYDCIANVFLTTDWRGNLKEITRKKLMEARISALRDKPAAGVWPAWAKKIEKLVDVLE